MQPLRYHRNYMTRGADFSRHALALLQGELLLKGTADFVFLLLVCHFEIVAPVTEARGHVAQKVFC